MMETFNPYKNSPPDTASIDALTNDTSTSTDIDMNMNVNIDLGHANANINANTNTNAGETVTLALALADLENQNGRQDSHNKGNGGHENEDDINFIVNTRTTTNTTTNNNTNNGDRGGENNPNNDSSTSSANNDEEDDIAFAAEAAANAVEEADAEQQRLDQALLRCRICGQGAMQGRPILRFLPMNPALANLTTQALPPGSPALATFPEDICLHIFCGKTASILPSVNQPDMEILTKAGIKNKHGIGAEVNAALARTRCANIVTLTLGVVTCSDAEETPSSTRNAIPHTTPNADSHAYAHANAANKQEKQYFLVREFEAHLAAIRSSHQTIPVPVPVPVPGILPLHLQVPPMLSAQLPRSVLDDPTPASHHRHLSGFPSCNFHVGSDDSTTGTLPNIVDGTKHHRILPTNDHSTGSGNDMQCRSNYFMSPGQIPMSANHAVHTFAAAMDGSAAPSPPQHSPQHHAASKFQPQSAAGQISTGAPSSAAKVLDLPSIMQDNFSHIVMTSTRSPQVPNATTSSQPVAAHTTPISPTRAAVGRTRAKGKTAKQNMQSLGELYLSPSENQPFTSDGKVKCDCGGTYLHTGTPKGAASWRNHVVTKRHQKWLRTHIQGADAGSNVNA